MLTSTKIILLGFTAIMGASAFKASADKPEESTAVYKPVECTSTKSLVQALTGAGFSPLVSNISLDENNKPEYVIQTWVTSDGKWAVVELPGNNVACLLGAGEKTVVHKRGVSV